MKTLKTLIIGLTLLTATLSFANNGAIVANVKTINPSDSVKIEFSAYSGYCKTTQAQLRKRLIKGGKIILKETTCSDENLQGPSVGSILILK